MSSYRIATDLSFEESEKLGNLPLLQKKLFRNRGILEYQEAIEFIRPDYSKLSDPFLFSQMEKVVDRILRAIKENEKIVAFTDYDADGIPAAVVLSDFFKKIGYANAEIYIPHRHDEGYGLNIAAIEQFAKNGVTLLITADCGIADVAEITRATELGIDVIVTDHHEPQAELPKAFAIINPKLSDETYPFKHLCGSGVIFQLIRAILARGGFAIPLGWEKWLLDMVGLATLSDMVPLIGENRILASFGLMVLKKTPRPGLKALLEKLNIAQATLSEDDIVFMITPRINAASRLGVPAEAFLLFTASDAQEAKERAAALDKINAERKGLVALMAKEAKRTLSLREELKEIIVIGNPEWRPSLAGLVANSLAEEHNRPVFAWGREGSGMIKGSCRSEGTIDVFTIMASVPAGFFADFGGHKYSGGFSLDEEHIHELETVLLLSWNELSQKLTEPESEILESAMKVDEVTEETWTMVSALAPFGTGNKKPLFLFEDVLISDVLMFGKENNHLMLEIKTNGKPLRAIAFFSTADSCTNIPEPGKRVNLVASIEKNTFRRFSELRLKLVDCI